VRERQIETAVAQEDHLLGAREDAKLRREAELEGVLPDQAGRRRRGTWKAGLGVAVWHERVHSLLHLRRPVVKVSAE